MFAAHDKHQLEGFAKKLLNNTHKVNTLIRRNEYEDTFICEVLYYWLSLDDDDPGCPHTWEALEMCISETGLDGTFAKAIRETYYPDPSAGVCVCCVCVCVNTFMIIISPCTL